MRIAAMLWAIDIPDLQVYLFRRLSPDLLKTHIEGPKGLRTLLNPLVESGHCQIVMDEIRFWNNSRIYLCHCQDDKDVYKYMGVEIHVLLIDELTQFTENMYRFIRSRVRAVGLNLPESRKGLFPRILCASNPGNVGHQFVKGSFIDGFVPMKLYKMADTEGGFLRQYIPARIEDNPTLENDNPEYRKALRGLGSPELVKAFELGDWNVVAGAYFPEFSTETHVIDPFAVPASWKKFRSMDWGSAKPFSVDWWAVSDGSIPNIPKDALVCYRQWYGAVSQNTGVNLTAKQVAEGMKNRQVDGEEFMYSVADPSIFKTDGGPSIAEHFRQSDIVWRKGDRERLSGWETVRQRLLGEEGKPMIYWFKTCVDTIRTLPVLQHDSGRPEDLDTKAEDHAADSIRYACMSRPYRLPVRPSKPVKDIHTLSLNDLWAIQGKSKRWRNRI